MLDTLPNELLFLVITYLRYSDYIMLLMTWKMQINSKLLLAQLGHLNLTKYQEASYACGDIWPTYVKFASPFVLIKRCLDTNENRCLYHLITLFENPTYRPYGVSEAASAIISRSLRSSKPSLTKLQLLDSVYNGVVKRLSIYLDTGLITKENFEENLGCFKAGYYNREICCELVDQTLIYMLGALIGRNKSRYHQLEVTLHSSYALMLEHFASYLIMGLKLV